LEDTSSQVVGALLNRRPLLTALARFDAREKVVPGILVEFPKNLPGIWRHRFQPKFCELAIDNGKFATVPNIGEPLADAGKELFHIYFYTINYKIKQKLVVFEKVCYYKISFQKALMFLGLFCLINQYKKYGN
jgi:hypothetical protein